MQRRAIIPTAGVKRRGHRSATGAFDDLGGQRVAGINLAARNHNIGPMLGESEHHLAT